ncbi:hypothetical protein [Micromonospora zamorensis]|uniref:hypothetical protein n=1 Tax=Micromonospora zamorensis TaxID=709883 RepID=UPI0033B25676
MTTTRWPDRPSQATPTGRAERSVLSALARHYRIPVAGLGHAACFGTYADVVLPGRLSLGQRVR